MSSKEEVKKNVIGAVKHHINHYLEEFFKNANFTDAEYAALVDDEGLQEALISQLAKLPVKVQMPDKQLIEATQTLRDIKAREVVTEFVSKREREQQAKCIQ